jgi:hypothetical protein
MNKYAGETDILIGDKKCTLVFNWRAIAEIHSTLGKDFIADLQNNVNPATIADVLLIGLKKLNPEVTREQILDASPPLLQTVQTVAEAIGFAYFGAEKPVKSEGGEQPTEKKT